MKESGATTVGTMRWQDAAEFMPRPRQVSSLRARFEQNSPCTFSKVYSTHWTSRICRNPLKTNDRGTLYPSQNRQALLSLEPRNPGPLLSSAPNTSRDFLSRKELECTHQLESQIWKSGGGFSWQLILL